MRGLKGFLTVVVAIALLMLCFHSKPVFGASTPFCNKVVQTYQKNANVAAAPRKSHSERHFKLRSVCLATYSNKGGFYAKIDTKSSP